MPFKCLGNQTAVQAKVSDHEPLVSEGIISANIMCQKRQNANPPPKYNNGFRDTEDKAEYIERLKKVAKMLGEAAKGSGSQVLALQEVPRQGTDEYKAFIAALKQELPDFDIDNALARATRDTSFGQLLICKKGYKLEDTTDKTNQHLSVQYGRVQTAKLIETSSGKEVRRIGNVHFEVRPTSGPQYAESDTLNDAETLLDMGITLCGDLNRGAPEFSDQNAAIKNNIDSKLVPLNTSTAANPAGTSSSDRSVDAILVSKKDPYLKWKANPMAVQSTNVVNDLNKQKRHFQSHGPSTKSHSPTFLPSANRSVKNSGSPTLSTELDSPEPISDSLWAKIKEEIINQASGEIQKPTANSIAIVESGITVKREPNKIDIISSKTPPDIDSMVKNIKVALKEMDKDECNIDEAESPKAAAELIIKLAQDPNPVKARVTDPELLEKIKQSSDPTCIAAMQIYEKMNKPDIAPDPTHTPLRM